MATEVTTGPAAARVEQLLIRFALLSRVAYCVYASFTTAIDIGGYRRPAWALVALAIALCASTGLGVLTWRNGTVPDRIAVPDTAIGVVVLVLVAAALPPEQRVGAANWALAYAVGCAIWLAGCLPWRGWLAAGLGIVYGIAVLSDTGSAGPARLPTALVNAGSPVLYWALARALATLWRRVGVALDDRQQRAARQRQELAAVAERQRLGREVHRSVLATLDLLGTGDPTGIELRARARVQAAALRRAFADLGSTRGGGVLAAQVASMAAERAAAGWTIEVVDEELDREPVPAASGALCRALAGLVAGESIGEGRVRVRMAGTDDEVHLVVRLRPCGRPVESLVTAAEACLAPVSGSVEPQRALPGEARLLLRVPS